MAQNEFAVGRSMVSEITAHRFFTNLSWVVDPDEILRKVGIRREHLRQLRNDDEITGACDTRLEAVIGTPWRLEPAEGAASRFVWEQLEPHMENLIRGSWSAVCYGYSVVQVIYTNLGSRVGIQAVIEEPIEDFVPTHTGMLLLARDGRSILEHGIDPRRLLVTVRNPSRLNPYGEALFSRLYWPWFFRGHGWRFWMKWLERFGSPFLVGKTKGDPAKMATALSEAVNAASMAVPEGDEVATVEQKQGTGHFESFDDVIVRRIQKLVLGQTLTTDVGDKGSFAAAKVHNDVRQDKRNADIRLVSRTIQGLVNSLWQLNNFGGIPPKFVMADNTGLEMDRAERDAILSEKLGIKFSDSYLVDRYDLEPSDFTRKEQPELLAGNPIANPSSTPSGKPPVHAALFDAGQKAIDRGFDKVLDLAPDGPITFSDMRSAVMAATDPQDLERRLAVLVSRESPEFERILAQAMFSARVLGFVSAETA